MRAKRSEWASRPRHPENRDPSTAASPGVSLVVAYHSRDVVHRLRSMVLLLSLAAGALAAFSCDSSSSRPLATPGPDRVVLEVTIDTVITNATRDFLIDSMEQAEQMGAEALIIRLDTPGGLLEATREIVREMLATEVPVVVYVSPQGARAGSAGVFLTLAAHVAAMAPTTHIGAAHPVGLFGGDLEGDMARKVENDTVAWAMTLAETRGRNREWAEKAVRESASLPAVDAVEQKVVDFIAPDLPALLQRLDGWQTKIDGRDHTISTAGARVQGLEMSGRQRMVTYLADPNLLYILLLVGLFLLFMEYKNPGLVVPGVVGALLLVLVLGVQALPLNWIGVILIVGSAALFVTEIYVTSFGLLSVAGLTCLIMGSYLLFDVQGSSLRVDTQIIWGVGLSFGVLLLTIAFLLVRAKRQGATSGSEGMVGEKAEVTERITAFEPGKVRFRGSYWRASAKEELLPGDEARVVKVDSTRVMVEKKES